MAGSEGVSSNVDKLGWWKKHEMDPPLVMQEFYKIVLFSHLQRQRNNCFHSCQTVLVIDNLVVCNVEISVNYAAV